MSEIRIAPFLNFQGKAREAMTHYQKVFGGKLSLFAMDGQGAPRPAGAGDRIAYGKLESDGAVLVASDGHPDYPAKVGDHIGLTVSGTDRDRLTGVYQGLAEGGQIKMPLTKQPWGAEAAWVTDRFGINWNINIEKA